MGFSKPKAPKPDANQLALEAQQREVSAQLDAQENERRKRLLNAAEGIRAYAGSPLFRAAPGDTAGNVGFFAGGPGAPGASAITVGRGGFNPGGGGGRASGGGGGRAR